MAETPELLDKLLRTPAPPRATRARPPPSGARPPPSPRSPATASAPRSPGSATTRRCSRSSATSTRSASSSPTSTRRASSTSRPIGGWDPQILVGQRVEVRGRDGLVPGVVGRKPIHLLDADAAQEGGRAEGPPHRHRRRRPRRGRGAGPGRRPGRDRRRAASAWPATASSRARWTTGSAPTSRSRRCAAATSATRSGPASPRSPPSRRRSACSAPAPPPSRCGPTSAIAVDVTHATDAPGVDEKEIGSHPLGSGPVIGRGSTLSPKVFELLVEAAEDAGHRAHDRRQRPRHQHRRRRASRSPARASRPASSRSPCATCTRRSRWSTSRDVEATVELIAAFAARLDGDVDLSR